MRNWIFVAFVLAVLCAVPAVTNAQSIASITGTVSDTSGAAVPGASVTLVDTRTNNSYFGKTAGDGSYRISDLPPGPGYALTVKKDGFQVFVVNSLYLPVATTTTQDVKLELGTVSQKVEVTAEGSVTLDTTDTQIGNNFDMHAVESLPNEFRDDPANLLRLEPGVVSAQQSTGQTTNATGAIDPNLSRDGSVAGSRADQGNIIVDGIDATSISGGFAFTTTAAVPVEAIQEFNTLVANPTPAYGGRGGAETLITTKSGSNTWHGTAFEYNRTAATEADSFFSNLSGIPRTALERNQFGGNVGGPVWKNKLFFFFEYDGRRDNSSAVATDTVPFPHVKNGQLAYINNSGDGTAGGSPCLTARLTSADQPTSCISFTPAGDSTVAGSVAALDPCSNPAINCAANTPGFQAPGLDPTLTSVFMSRYPNPNDYSAGDGINTAGFIFNYPNGFKENNYLARTDFNINSSNKLFIRFDFVNTNGVLDAPEFKTDPETSANLDKDRAWVIGETWTVNANVINQFTYGETREDNLQPILFNPSPGFFELTFDNGYTLPFFRGTSFTQVTPEPTFRDDVTWVHGKHTFVFGGEYNPIVLGDGIDNDFDFVQNGFGGFVKGLAPAQLPANLQPQDASDPNGAALANWEGAFVGGLGSIFDEQDSVNFTKNGTALPAGSSVDHDYRLRDYAAYFQDSWRVLPSLTITAGVRYQYQSVPYEVHGVEATVLNTNFRDVVDARVANGLAGIATLTSTPLLTYSEAGPINHAPGYYSPDHHDFSPRIGLAWNPSYHDGVLGKILGDHKTVIRAGGSMIWDETVINNVIALENQGDFTFGGQSSENFGTSGDSLASLEFEPRLNSLTAPPAPPAAITFQSPVTPAFSVFSAGGVTDRFRTPYSFIASLGFQRELPGGLQLEADYYGNFSRELFVISDAGQLMDFTDPASHQTLVQAITKMEIAAQAGAASVAPQPFFEDIDGPGATAAIYSADQFVLSRGGTADVAFGAVPPNIGFTPQFDVNFFGTNQGSSSYNALFMTLRKRLSNNLQFDFNYTYSHAIDNNSTDPHANGNFEQGVTSVLCNALDTHACRGNAEFDATDAITALFVYDLPFGRGQHFGGNVGWFVNEAIGGWEISGIETWRTGLAFTMQDGVASTTSLAADAGDIFVGPRSALAESIHIETDNNNQVEFYKNPTAAAAAFVPNLGLETGTRDNLRGPHFSNFDAAVSKNFPLWNERYRLQFRAEAYNAFNHTNFGIPNATDTAGPSFGQLTTQAGQEPDRVMQFALRFDF
jgi:hypothetical protein